MLLYCLFNYMNTVFFCCKNPSVFDALYFRCTPLFSLEKCGDGDGGEVGGTGTGGTGGAHGKSLWLAEVMKDGFGGVVW